MPKIQYIDKTFTPRVEVRIAEARAIIDEYSDQGFSLTLRQLFYQFVSRGLLDNTERNYKNLGSWINNARLAGLIDWSSIEDRTRNVIKNPHWKDPGQILFAVAEQFMIDKWKDQEMMIEVWIEKEALTGVFEDVCLNHDVPLYSCRGYNSQSEMWRGARRARYYNKERDQYVTVLYFGDHDPSGLDMDRDLKDRFEMFGAEVDVKRVALTMDQIKQYNPPPNPTKPSDARAPGYVSEFGHKSWELDALDPKVLAQLVTDFVVANRDSYHWKLALEKEQEYKNKLFQFAKTWKD